MCWWWCGFSLYVVFHDNTHQLMGKSSIPGMLVWACLCTDDCLCVWHHFNRKPLMKKISSSCGNIPAYVLVQSLMKRRKWNSLNFSSVYFSLAITTTVFSEFIIPERDANCAISFVVVVFNITCGSGGVINYLCLIWRHALIFCRIIRAEASWQFC